MNTARESILIHGLVDWVSLARVHSDVLPGNPSALLSEVQNQTLETIRSLVNDGLFEVGDLSGEDGRFVAWDTPLEESIKTIYDLYVTHFDDKNRWIWECWLNLTDKGERIARLLVEENHESLN